MSPANLFGCNFILDLPLKRPDIFAIWLNEHIVTKHHTATQTSNDGHTLGEA
jgi:hypothetical protein